MAFTVTPCRSASKQQNTERAFAENAILNYKNITIKDGAPNTKKICVDIVCAHRLLYIYIFTRKR